MGRPVLMCLLYRFLGVWYGNMTNGNPFYIVHLAAISQPTFLGSLRPTNNQPLSEPLLPVSAPLAHYQNRENRLVRDRINSSTCLAE